MTKLRVDQINPKTGNANKYVRVNAAGTALVFAAAGADASDAEFIRDTMGTALVAGTGLTKVVNDPGDSITLAVDTVTEAERIRDVIGAAARAGTGLTLVVDDAGDTITYAIDLAAEEERIEDVMAGALVAGTNVTLAYDDVAGTLTINASGGGGGSAHTIQDEGVSLTARTVLNFVGAGVTVTDDSATGKTVVTIPGGGGGATGVSPFLLMGA